MDNTAYTIEVSVDLDDVLERVYAASAWHVLCSDRLQALTPDNRGMLLMRLREGYNAIASRLAAYTSLANFNPDLETANVRFALQFRHEQSPELATCMANTIANALANFALMRHYASSDAYYATAWKKYLAELQLYFLRDANGLPA